MLLMNMEGLSWWAVQGSNLRPLLVSPLPCFSSIALFSTAYDPRSCPQPVETYGNDLRLSAFGSYDFDYIKMG